MPHPVFRVGIPKILIESPPRPGGSFVAANFCVSSEGHFLGSTEVGVSMWDSFAKCWGRLHDEGVIDAAELRAVSFPSYYRSKREMCEVRSL